MGFFCCFMEVFGSLGSKSLSGWSNTRAIYFIHKVLFQCGTTTASLRLVDLRPFYPEWEDSVSQEDLQACSSSVLPQSQYKWCITYCSNASNYVTNHSHFKNRIRLRKRCIVQSFLEVSSICSTRDTIWI